MCQLVGMCSVSRRQTPLRPEEPSVNCWQANKDKRVSSHLHGSWRCALGPGACWRITLLILDRLWRSRWGADQRRGQSHCIWGREFCRGLTGSVGLKIQILTHSQSLGEYILHKQSVSPSSDITRYSPETPFNILGLSVIHINCVFGP